MTLNYGMIVPVCVYINKENFQLYIRYDLKNESKLNGPSENFIIDFPVH